MGTGRVNSYAPPRPRGLKGHGKQKKSSPVTFERGQTEPLPTRLVDGRHKVVLPPNRLKMRGFYRSADGSERV